MYKFQKTCTVHVNEKGLEDKNWMDIFFLKLSLYQLNCSPFSLVIDITPLMITPTCLFHWKPSSSTALHSCWNTSLLWYHHTSDTNSGTLSSHSDYFLLSSRYNNCISRLLQYPSFSKLSVFVILFTLGFWKWSFSIFLSLHYYSDNCFHTCVSCLSFAFICSGLTRYCSAPLHFLTQPNM